MKRASKWIVLAVALTFLFSMAAPAFADGAAATNRLVGLGIVEGDPNGDLRLGDTITRAEFAKVAVIAAGMKEAAAILKSAPSQFSDVKVNEWYTGWINVAAAQGLVKGDPDGNYRPNDKISGAEVVTVLLRLLGYNDNLQGSWPTDYIVKGAALGIMKDVSFNAQTPAVRGDVFTMSSATLDQKLVIYSTDKSSFEEKTGAITLLADSFKGTKVEKKLVEDVKVVDGKVKLVVAGTEITVSNSVSLTGIDNIYNADGKIVDYTTIKVDDKDQIIAVVDKAATVKNFKAKVISYPGNDTKIQVGDKTEDQFTIAADVVYYLDFAKQALVDADNPTDGIFDELRVLIEATTNENLDLVLNSKNEVVAIKAYGPAATTLVSRRTIVDKVDAPKLKITAKDGANIDLDETNKDLTYLILKNGKKVGFADLEKYDVVYKFGTRKGVNNLMVVVGQTAQGQFTKLSGTDVYVGTTKYSAGATQKVYNDAGSAVAVADLLGENITVQKDFVGKAAVVLGPKVDKSEVVGVVTQVITADNSDPRTGTVYFIKLFTKDGSKVTYDFDSDYAKEDKDANNTKDILELGEAVKGLVTVQLNAEGKIKSIALTATTAVTNNKDSDNDAVNDYKSFDKNLEENLNRINVDNAGDYKYVTDSTVFINISDAAKPALTDWATLKGLSDDTAKITLEYKADSKGALQYLVVTGGTLAAEAKKAVYVGAYTDAAKKDRVEVSYDGTIVDFEKGTGAPAKYDIVDVTMSGSKANLSTVVAATAKSAITNINNSFQEITLANAQKFVVTGSTKIISVKDNKVVAITFSDLEDSDNLTVSIKDGAATIIVKH